MGPGGAATEAGEGAGGAAQQAVQPGGAVSETAGAASQAAQGVGNAAGQAAQAEEEWDRCLNRRGEAADAFFADTSSLRYLSPVNYRLGRAREAVGAADAAKHSYRDFLKLREQADPPDPLAIDARLRIGQR